LSIPCGQTRESPPFFATTQRWLMAHIALSAFLSRANRPGRPGAPMRPISSTPSCSTAWPAGQHADSFLKGNQKYGLSPELGRRGRSPHSARSSRRRSALKAISAWLAAHLTTLDALDGGDRRAAFLARPQAIAGDPTVDCRAGSSIRRHFVRQRRPSRCSHG